MKIEDFNKAKDIIDEINRINIFLNVDKEEQLSICFGNGFGEYNPIIYIDEELRKELILFFKNKKIELEKQLEEI